MTYKSENEANLSVVNSFGEYGFVIINTHGDYNGFAIKSEISKFSTAKADSTEYSVAELKNILASAAGLPLSKISSGELKLSTIVHYNGNNASIKIEGKMGIIVTDKYVKSMPAMKNAIVFGNYCFSGYARENNIPEAFKSIGAKSFCSATIADSTLWNLSE